MTSEFDDDPIHQLLSPAAAPRADVKGAILAKTQGVLRRRRYLRRAGYALALAGCYLAGMLTTSLTTPQAPVIAQQDRPAPVDHPAPIPASPPRQIAIEKPAKQQRPKVARGRPTRFEKLRRAADRALLEQGDMMAAVTLYKKALDVAKPEELAISVERDNWLLISLKEARLQEKQNAKQG